MTKPIILVKICYKLLYVIQGVENSFGKVTSWPQLISEFLVAHACMFAMLLLIGLALFYTPGVFAWYITTFCKQILLLCGSICKQMLL